MKVAELRERAGEIGFTPADQVRWFSPGELIRTAIDVALSTTFAGYVDRREVQAALPSRQIPLELDAPEELWLDYVSDLGDGFDSTFTVASLVAAELLEVTDVDGQIRSLPRGSALVMGGDEVYPTPSAVAYEDRTRGPYRAALPKDAVPEGQGPMLLALPGNHDWYDGLTAFLRLFCQRRPIGGWRTEQTRSYFAVKVNLPSRWWVVGVDTQLGTYIDEPQIDYFRQHLSSQLKPGDAVILCAPEPTWSKVEHNPDAFNSLNWFEENVIRVHEDEDGTRRPTDARVRLWLSGDLHHYARYAEVLPDDAPPTGSPDDGRARQYITCGLGGGYTTETHQLAAELLVPPPQSRLVDPDRTPLRLLERYPSPERTRALARRILSLSTDSLPLRNPGFWRLCGTVHAALMLLMIGVLGLETGQTPAAALRWADWLEVLRMAGQAGVVALVVAVFYLVGRAVRRGPPRRWASPQERLKVMDAVGGVLLQAVLAFGALAVVVQIPWPGWPTWLLLLVLLIGYLIVVGLLSAYLVAVSILLGRSALVRAWPMPALSDENHKGFLRLQFAADGAWVQVHPLVVDKVHREWDVRDGRPVPKGSLPRPRLVEAPVRIARSPEMPAG